MMKLKMGNMFAKDLGNTKPDDSIEKIQELKAKKKKEKKDTQKE